MYKAELKNYWGMYCDTDKLVDDMMALLNKYHHDCTENGIGEILNTYFMNKRPLIDMFMKSDSYVGNMRICIDVELDRNSNPNEIVNFCKMFPAMVEASKVFFKYVDEHGKTLKDYMRTGIGRFKARNLCYGNLAETLSVHNTNRDKFRTDGVTKESHSKYIDFCEIINGFRNSTGSGLTSDTLNYLQYYKVDGRFVTGMKTGRAFNRVCNLYGVDRLPNYNKLFAEYSDMVSGLKRKLKFYISLNPLDYLTMSFGNSWASCHTIDKKNDRHMPNNYSGAYCGGTLSYMLDETSIITYVHTKETEDHEEGKIYRNMFHFGGGTLVQGRIYPQGNDGATDLYRTFRRFMQIEMTKLLGLDEDEWIKKKGGCYDNIVSDGVHYRDYENFVECNVSYPREMPDASTNIITVGHVRICPYCGEEVDDDDKAGWLTHEECEVNDDDED